MLDSITASHRSQATTDILVELATFAVGLAIAIGLRFAFDAWRRRRARRSPSNPELP
jgi:hypothetical protein